MASAILIVPVSDPVTAITFFACIIAIIITPSRYHCQINAYS